MWTTVNFGKHAGRTLPQVVLRDPNWFFWAVGKGVLYGRLEFEANALERRATNIKIPKRHPEKWEVEYRWDRDYRFLRAFHAPLASYLPYLDLSYVRRGDIHDIRDCRRLIHDFRRLYFKGRNLTKRRCECFFQDKKHFTKAGWGSMLR